MNKKNPDSIESGFFFMVRLYIKNKSDIDIRLYFYFNLPNYSATFVESQQAFTESLQACACSLSQQAFAESQTASTVSAFFAALFPQEAKDTAANATNKNTNFFIFFTF